MRLPIFLLAATLMYAQDKPAETKQEPSEAEIIPVKTLTGDSFERLIKLLEVFQVHYKGDSQLRTIVVYAPKDVVAQMRRVFEQLDRPGSEAAIGRNIEMTLTLLRCSTKAPAAASSLPPDMESVARQLRAATQYKDIQVWDVVPLHIQEGKETHDTLRLPNSGTTPYFPTGTIKLFPESVYRKDQVRYVRFSNVDLGFRFPFMPANGQFNFQDVGLRTSGDFQEGQKTVLGKVSGVEEGDAIFAVIALKVLD
jgi:hypothetical protein